MSIIELRVCGRYKLGPKIGVGSFGSIYLAKNVQSNSDVAIKIEEVKAKHPQLLYEGKILQNLQGGVGIPSMHWCG
jgi:serine/threonine protein kinase